MKDFNPFNPPKDSPMGGRGAARMDALFSDLEAKASGQAAPPAGAAGGQMHHHHHGGAPTDGGGAPGMPAPATQ